MTEGNEIFQNVLIYKQENDITIQHGRRSNLKEIFKCTSFSGVSSDFCLPGIVWIILMMWPLFLPVIVGGGGLALLIFFLSFQYFRFNSICHNLYIFTIFFCSS